ncbi:MAG: PTS sugar transporter subunit IIA [Spirochaetia bacterium]|nr:PTS sugar transporter subunit IIA [Spirochaetia bacterium]
MDLSMKDVVELLEVPESEVLKYIKTRNLPAHKISHRYRFNEEELKEWVVHNGITVSGKFHELNLLSIPVSISGLLSRGGIIYGVSGKNVKDILSGVVSRMTLPAEVKKEAVLESLIEREEMMPTAVGRGIAIPHPRNPIISEIQNESITACALSMPVDYGAVDGKKVHTMFVIMSANARRHLEILSKLLYICQQPEFIKLLESGAGFNYVLEYVASQEKAFRERHK